VWSEKYECLRIMSGSIEKYLGALPPPKSRRQVRESTPSGVEYGVSPPHSTKGMRSVVCSPAGSGAERNAFWHILKANACPWCNCLQLHTVSKSSSNTAYCCCNNTRRGRSRRRAFRSNIYRHRSLSHRQF